MTTIEPLLTRLRELQERAKSLHHDARDHDLRSDVRELSREISTFADVLVSGDAPAGVARPDEAVHDFASRLQRLERQSRRTSLDR